MKNLIGVILILLLSPLVQAKSPIESLEISVNKLIAIAVDKTADENNQIIQLTKVISEEVDFESVGRRVVSKKWKKASDEQKKEFKQRFLKIMVDTYYGLLKNYTNEKVLFLKEQLKSTKNNEYAIVDTKIISGNKKIPVRYRLIKLNDSWKIYDFVPEGISLITTYKKNYASILKKKGVEGLLENMAENKNASKE
jgi:phospholipid transport system substrate-binding protein